MNPASSVAERTLREATATMSPIGLGDLLARADLQTRTDRKYFVPAATFERLTAELAGGYDVLEIEGRRVFGYESVYFDSPRHSTYRAHLQRRRKRYKIRTRTYLDSGDCMLELKMAGRRDGTVKVRTPYPVTARSRLSDAARLHLGDLLDDAYGLALPEFLDVALTTTYRRATLVSRTEQARLTCDVGLACRAGGRDLTARKDHVLVESKSAGAGSRADRLLREYGVRPSSVSKYCVGVAALHPELSSNPWHSTLRRYFDWSLDATTPAVSEVA